MDCHNCGAPVRVLEGRDYGVCEFCESYCFPTPLEESADGITPSGYDGEHACPRCNERLMAATVDTIAVEYCEDCRGFLVENEAFAEIVRQRRAAFRGAEQNPTPLNQEELQRRIECPRCAAAMDVHPYYGPGNVVIDSCCRCGLVWMDHGELSHIEAAPGRR